MYGLWSFRSGWSVTSPVGRCVGGRRRRYEVLRSDEELARSWMRLTVADRETIEGHMRALRGLLASLN